MASLSIPDLPDELHSKLHLRAAETGRSIEAEAQAILTAALTEPEPFTSMELQDWVDRLYGANKPAHVVEDLIAERRREAESE